MSCNTSLADSINAQAYRYAQSVLPQVENFCQPILGIGLEVFAYFRFFNNGRYLYLCNKLDWLKYCLENVHNNEGTSLGKELKYVSKGRYHYFLWPKKKSDYLMTALYEFNIWNGLSVFKEGEDSIELWGFATNRKKDLQENFYIENIDFIKNITNNFTECASDIIIPSINRLAIYKDFKPGNKCDKEMKTELDKFIKLTPIRKIPIITSAGEIFLSQREIECLNSLSFGKTSKEIGIELNLSPRSIEKHIENIKIKFNGSKEDIIKIYLESAEHWL